MVPRYFMNVRYRDRLYRDEEGDVLPEVEAVRAHAIQCAQDLVEKARMDAIRNWFDCALEVTDEAGRIVLTIPFGPGSGEDRL